MSNALEFQLFVGLPANEIELDGNDADKYGLKSYTAGNNVSGSGDVSDDEGDVKEFIGLILGDPVSWDGGWSDEMRIDEFEKARKNVVRGFAKAKVGKKPGLYWLANFY